MTESRDRSSRRTLLLLALIAAAPMVAAYVAYYWLTPSARTNYGELVAAGPIPDFPAQALDGTNFPLSKLRGKWVLLMVDKGACEENCLRKLYAMRQARTMQNREQDRIARVWLISDATTPAPELLKQHPDLYAARADTKDLQSLSSDTLESHLFLFDPLGNVVMRYGADPDIKRLSQDLVRLLKASRIG